MSNFKLLKRLPAISISVLILLILQILETNHSLVLQAQSSIEDLQIITSRNANQLRNIKTLGRGSFDTMTATADGLHIVVANPSGSWMYNNNKLRSQWAAPTLLTSGGTSNASLSPDGQILALSRNEFDHSEIILWDIATNAEIAQIKSPNNEFIGALVFNPNGRQIIFDAGDDLYLWDVVRQKQLAVLKGHTDDVWTIAVSPDGNLLASNQLVSPQINIWNLNSISATESPTATLTMPNSSFVEDIAFMPDGKSLLAAYSNDTKTVTISLYDLRTGKELRSIGTHSWPVGTLIVSSDGRLAASGGAIDSTEIRLWDISQGKLLFTLPDYWGGVTDMMFIQDDKFLLAAYSVGIIRIWDTATGKLVNVLNGYNDYAVLGAHTGRVNSLSISKDSHVLASGGIDGTVRLWNISSGKEIEVLGAHPAFVTSVNFSPDNSLLASSDDAGNIMLWDVERKTVHSSLKGHTKSIQKVTFSPNGDVLASAADDGTVRLWNVQSGQATILTPSDEAGQNSVVFSPDGKLVATGGNDGLLQLWQMNSNTSVEAFKGCNEITGIAFNPKGQLIVCSDWDGALNIWNVKSKQKYATLHSRGRYLYNVAFSPNGQVLAYGSRYSLELWSVYSFSPINFGYAEFSYTVSGLTFSPDGKILAFGNDDGTIELWGVPETTK